MAGARNYKPLMNEGVKYLGARINVPPGSSATRIPGAASTLEILTMSPRKIQR